MPKISVIVPVYNVEAYLPRCIDSILAQSFKYFELILVDDGSPDNCGKICDDYSKKDDRIVVIHKENGGLSAARNAGLDWSFANSNSEWIAFIDSDDWVHKDYLKILYTSCLENNTLISICGFQYTSGTIDDTDMVNSSLRIIIPEEIWCSEQLLSILAWNKLYKKELWINIRFPIGKQHEDEFTTHRLLFQCDYISFLPFPLYYYFQREDSIMRKPWNLKRLDAIEALQSQIDFFDIKGIDSCYLYSIRRYFDNIIACISLMKKNGFNLFYQMKYIREFKKNLKKHELILRRFNYDTQYYYQKAYPLRYHLRAIKRIPFNITCRILGEQKYEIIKKTIKNCFHLFFSHIF